MNLNTIEEVRGATAVDGGAVEWREGDSWLAGGTWLFSEPQPHLRRLLDLRTLGWPPLEVERARPAHRRHLHHRRALRVPRAPGLAGVVCDRRVLPLLPLLVQDLEHGHRRRQHLHVPAGWSDDLARHVAWKGSTPCRSLDGSERQVPAIEFVTGQPSECAAAGRAAAHDRAAGLGAAQAGGIPPDVADPHGALDRAR